jgi:hypothetical protein
MGICTAVAWINERRWPADDSPLDHHYHIKMRCWRLFSANVGGGEALTFRFNSDIVTVKQKWQLVLNGDAVTLSKARDMEKN